MIEFFYGGYYFDHKVMPYAELVQKVKDVDLLMCEHDIDLKDVK